MEGAGPLLLLSLCWASGNSARLSHKVRVRPPQAPFLRRDLVPSSGLPEKEGDQSTPPFRGAGSRSADASPARAPAARWGPVAVRLGRSGSQDRGRAGRRGEPGSPRAGVWRESGPAGRQGEVGGSQCGSDGMTASACSLSLPVPSPRVLLHHLTLLHGWLPFSVAVRSMESKMVISRPFSPVFPTPQGTRQRIGRRLYWKPLPVRNQAQSRATPLSHFVLFRKIGLFFVKSSYLYRHRIGLLF